VPPQHAQSRFLKVAVVSRFLVKHPKVSRFITAHLPALCPFLPPPPCRPRLHAQGAQAADAGVQNVNIHPRAKRHASLRAS